MEWISPNIIERYRWMKENENWRQESTKRSLMAINTCPAITRRRRYTYWRASSSHHSQSQSSTYDSPTSSSQTSLSLSLSLPPILTRPCKWMSEQQYSTSRVIARTTINNMDGDYSPLEEPRALVLFHNYIFSLHMDSQQQQRQQGRETAQRTTWIGSRTISTAQKHIKMGFRIISSNNNNINRNRWVIDD